MHVKKQTLYVYQHRYCIRDRSELQNERPDVLLAVGCVQKNNCERWIVNGCGIWDLEGIFWNLILAKK
jgi:hypothetical protein